MSEWSFSLFGNLELNPNIRRTEFPIITVKTLDERCCLKLLQEKFRMDIRKYSQKEQPGIGTGCPRSWGSHHLWRCPRIVELSH